MTNVALAASGVGLLATLIAAPNALGLQAGAIMCGLLGGRRETGRLEVYAKARKHNQIRVLAESKLNTIAHRISVALNDDKITEEELRLILSEVDEYNQMKNEFRGRHKQSGGLSEDERNGLFQSARDEAMMTARAKLLKEIEAGTSSGT